MYDTDTVRHITRCLRNIEKEHRETSATRAEEANKAWNPDATDRLNAEAYTHVSIANAFRDLRLELEGDYAG